VDVGNLVKHYNEFLLHGDRFINWSTTKNNGCVQIKTEKFQLSCDGGGSKCHKQHVVAMEQASIQA